MNRRSTAEEKSRLKALQAKATKGVSGHLSVSWAHIETLL